MAPQNYWRKCTTCKTEIGFGQRYYICSVSTCNRLRTGLIFCDVACFDAHVPVLNHKDAGAYEKRSPSRAEWLKEQEAAARPPSAPRAASGAGSGGASASGAGSSGTGAGSAGAGARPTAPSAPVVMRRSSSGGESSLVSAPGPAAVSRVGSSISRDGSRDISAGNLSSSASNATVPNAANETEILVVVSKIKEYIQKRSGGMSTSNSVMKVLSKWVRLWSNDAIRKAAQDGRKTVLDRDFKR